jgi:hypothetical protein
MVANVCWTRWCIPEMPALGRLRQEDLQFKASQPDLQSKTYVLKTFFLIINVHQNSHFSKTSNFFFQIREAH